MVIQDWAAIGEIVSSLAILVTLVYLAIQTRQNTAAVQSSVRHTMLEEDRESLRMVIEKSILNRRVNLTAEQETQVQAFLIHFLRTRENHYLQYLSGSLDKPTWISYRSPLIPVVFSSAYGRAL